VKIRYFILLFLASAAPTQAQTQPQILAELFCSFGCANCPTPDNNYDAFVSQNPSYGIVVINYHNNIVSGNSDEFYKESKSDVDARDGSSYYNVTGDPAAFIDGYVSLSSPQNEWVGDTKTAHNVPLTPLTVAPKAGFGSDGLIHITFKATGPSLRSSIVRVALKESQIHFANTFPSGYGNPPDSIWNDIFRAMLPNSSDTTSLGPGETRSFDVAFDPNQFLYGGNWNTQNMDAVVFVQDVPSDGGKGFDVESIGVVSLASAGAVTPLSGTPPSSIRVAGLPSNPDLIVSLSASNPVRIIISDMLGRQVHTFVAGMMQSGQTTVDLTGAPLSPGCYIARLVVNGQDSDHAKIIITQ
jgi:hypothetical protein